MRSLILTALAALAAISAHASTIDLFSVTENGVVTSFALSSNPAVIPFPDSFEIPSVTTSQGVFDLIFFDTLGENRGGFLWNTNLLTTPTGNGYGEQLYVGSLTAPMLIDGYYELSDAVTGAPILVEISTNGVTAEPGSVVLLGSGLAALWFLRRRGRLDVQASTMDQ